MRARYPDVEGVVDRDGLRIGYEVFGDGEPTIAPPPHLDDHPFPILENAGALPLPSLPGGHL